MNPTYPLELVINMKLTQAAKGKECTVQIYPYCNNNPETTVFAHAPSEDKGWGIKSPDWWGAFACSTCHNIVDGRMKVDLRKDEIYRCFMRGVYRTLKIQIEDGNIRI